MKTKAPLSTPTSRGGRPCSPAVMRAPRSADPRLDLVLGDDDLAEVGITPALQVHGAGAERRRR